MFCVARLNNFRKDVSISYGPIRRKAVKTATDVADRIKGILAMQNQQFFTVNRLICNVIIE